MARRGRRPRERALAVAFAAFGLMLAVVGCASPAASDAPSALRVVTTTTVFADMVRQVGGARVSVDSLVPRGGEVHTFDPKPSDIRRVTEARLVVLNGLGLDGWVRTLVEDAGTDADIVALGEGLDEVRLLPGGPGGPADATVNPHLWLDVGIGSRYAARIADALAAADPAGADAYARGAAAYRARLADLDAYARQTLGAIPAANRVVVSFHDAFPYFAAAYGLTVDGTIVTAPGQDPSAGEIARLITAVRARGVRAIFAEAQFSEDIVRTIADETGASVVSDLYTDSVGDAPVDTYEAMMRWNVDRVAAALRG